MRFVNRCCTAAMLSLATSVAFAAPATDAGATREAGDKVEGRNEGDSNQAQPGVRRQNTTGALEQPGQANRANLAGPGRVQRTAQRPVAGAAMTADQMIATCLSLKNQVEVVEGRMAAEKAQDKQVREFAQHMVEDHGKMVKQLEKFAPDAPMLTEFASKQTRGQGDEARPTAAAQSADRNEDRKGEGQDAQMAFDPASFQREVAEQCIASCRKNMAEHQGAEAEMHYVGAQIVLHQQMLDELTVARNHVSGEFRTLIDQGIETTQQHKDHAEKLIKTLKHDHAGAKADSNDKR